VQQEQAVHAVATMCRVLGVSPSGYYAWRYRPPSTRAQADQRLLEQVRAIHVQSRQTDGAPRIHVELREAGVQCGRKRVARLMRTAGLEGAHRRRRTRTTVQDPLAAPAPDLVARTFVADRPDRLWVADITYVRTWAGWLYLAVVLDAFSRKIVGWSMADHLRTDLVIDALNMAVWNRRPEPGAGASLGSGSPVHEPDLWAAVPGSRHPAVDGQPRRCL